MSPIGNPPCQREVDIGGRAALCGHGWNVHGEREPFKCRVTGCPCLAYAEHPVEAPQFASEVAAEALKRVAAGQLVVLVPGGPETVPFMQLAILRQFLGKPGPGDPAVALVCVEPVKPKEDDK